MNKKTRLSVCLLIYLVENTEPGEHREQKIPIFASVQITT